MRGMFFPRELIKMIKLSKRPPSKAEAQRTHTNAYIVNAIRIIIVVYDEYFGIINIA